MIPKKPVLTIESLKKEAARFSEAESIHEEPSLFGVTDGKAVGTYLEHKFVAHLLDAYQLVGGNSAVGIDLPELGVDIKVTSIRQPQSSSPFRSARQKIYGLGYHLVVFIYDKHDDPANRTSRLDMQHAIFVDKEYSASVPGPCRLGGSRRGRLSRRRSAFRGPALRGWPQPDCMPESHRNSRSRIYRRHRSGSAGAKA